MVLSWFVQAATLSTSPVSTTANGPPTPSMMVEVGAVVGVACCVVGLAIQDDEDPIGRLTRMVRRAAAGESVDFDLDGDDRVAELADAIGDLVDAVGPRDGATVERYRRELYEVTVEADLTDEEKVERVLELGCDRFAVDCGLISRIDRETGECRVETTVGSDFATEGMVTDVSKTFCSETIETDDILSIYDAEREGYGDDPGYEDWGVDAYLGAKLLVDDALYGTVCFVGETPRDHQFTSEERTFADLLSRWLSQVIERREHFDRLRLVNRGIEAAPIGIAFADADRPDNPLVRVNPAFEEITGYAAEEVLRRNCRFLQGPDTDEEAVARMRDAIDEREPVTVELRNYRADGTTFWNRVTIAPVTDGEGAVTHFIGFQEDVTERTERQRKYERYRAFTDDIIDSVDDVYYVIEQDGSFRRWNRSFAELTEYDDAEIAAMHALDFFPEEYWPAIAEAIEGVFETGVGRIQAPVLTKSGERVDYEFVASELEDPKGEPVLVGIGRDITERRRYRDELERTTDMLQQASRLARFGGWELDVSVDPPEMSWTEELYDIHDVDPGTPIDLETALEFYHPADRDGVRTRIEEAIETGRGYDVEVRALTTDGETCWVRTVGEAVEEDGEVTRLRGAIQDVTEQKEREFALESLHESTRGLLNADTTLEAAEVVVDAATAALDLAAVALFVHDEERNRLEPTATAGDVADHLGTDPTPIGPREDSVLWQAFVTASPTVLDGGNDAGDRPIGAAVDDGLAVPIGAHGVFLAVSGGGSIDDDTRRLVETLVASAEAGFDRIESETELRDRDGELEARNERLRRQIRVNETIRAVDRTLVGATNQADLESAVCAELAAGDDVAFAWIGGFGDAGDALVPRAWAGDGEGYLDSGDFSRSSGSSEPAVTAAESGEPTLVENVAEDVQHEPWRREALAAVFQSVVAVPLVLEEYRYGVLAAYARDPHTFGDLERTVFAELGESIANAITTVSTRQALHADTLVSLSLRLEGSTDPLSGIATAANCRVRFEGLATHSGDETRLFVTTEGTDAKAVASVLDDRHVVTDYRLVRESDDGDVFEVTLRSPSVVTKLVRHGGHPRSLVVEPDALDVAVDVPTGTDVRAFIEMLEEDFDVELQGRREVARSLQTRFGVIEAILDALTERQHEVLRTAYLAGFFNWPRDTTGEELATMLDVSQPTVNRHLRLAEQTIMEQLFEDEQTTE